MSSPSTFCSSMRIFFKPQISTVYASMLVAQTPASSPSSESTSHFSPPFSISQPPNCSLYCAFARLSWICSSRSCSLVRWMMPCALAREVDSSTLRFLRSFNCASMFDWTSLHSSSVFTNSSFKSFSLPCISDCKSMNLFWMRGQAGLSATVHFFAASLGHTTGCCTGVGGVLGRESCSSLPANSLYSAALVASNCSKEMALVAVKAARMLGKCVARKSLAASDLSSSNGLPGALDIKKDTSPWCLQHFTGNVCKNIASSSAHADMFRILSMTSRSPAITSNCPLMASMSVSHCSLCFFSSFAVTGSLLLMNSSWAFARKLSALAPAERALAAAMVWRISSMVLDMTLWYMVQRSISVSRVIWDSVIISLIISSAAPTPPSP
mmetsp:Transcript_18901/g.44098  ORF Transcript_18901/g.44098 Transcript_18901/m.44098 type:complete len:382 (+) Transcript_18901:1654-2799(+)